MSRRKRGLPPIAPHTPVTARIDGTWKHTEVVGSTDRTVTLVDVLPNRTWTHLREQEGTTWIYGHANASELAALACAYALAETDS